MHISSFAGNLGLPSNEALFFSAFDARWSHGSLVDGAQSCGRGESFRTSVLSAFSELLERVSVRSGRSPRLEHADTLPVFEGFAPFLDGQELSKTYEKDWSTGPTLPGYDLIHGIWENIPADLIQFRSALASHARRFPPVDTTGYACNANVESAIFAGTMELLEKNCLILMWLSKRVFAELDHEGSRSERLQHLLTVSKRLGLCPRFFDVSFIPGFRVVFVLAKNSFHFPYYAVGAAAALSDTSAMESALAECLQLHASYSGMLFQTNFRVTRDFGSHAIRYLDRNNAADYSADYGFLDRNVPLVSPKEDCHDSSAGSLNYLRKHLFPQLKRLFFVPFFFRSFRNHVCCRVISPDLFWSMIPESLDLPLNRALLLKMYPDILSARPREMLLFP